MAFKKAPPPTDVASSPDKLFLALPRRKIPDVLPHQREILRRYSNEALGLSDVALQLPTGSGKTLVGLLIAEWRRRKFGERVLYAWRMLSRRRSFLKSTRHRHRHRTASSPVRVRRWL